MRKIFLSAYVKQYGWIFLTCFVLIGLYTNFSAYSPTANNFYNYYLTQLTKCTSTDHSTCPGEVTYTDWEIGPGWGVRPFTLYADIINGVSQSMLYPVRQSRQMIIRNTGVNLTLWKNPDLFFAPQLKEEYSYAYDPTLGAAVSNQMRSTKSTYYYNQSLIPGNPDGLTYSIIGLQEIENLQGLGTITKKYSLDGRLLSEDRYGIKTEYTYNSNGDILTKSNWRDGIKKTIETLTNYKRGVPQTITKPEGIVEYKVVNDDGTLYSETDGRGKTRSYSYDEIGRLKTTTYANLSVETTTRPDENTEVTIRGNLKKEVLKDSLDRVVLVKMSDVSDPNKVSYVETKWDAEGRQYFKSQVNWGQPSTYGEETSYDILDRVVKVTNTANGSKAFYNYQTPNQVVMTKPLGQKMTYSYLSYGSPKEQSVIKIVEDKIVSPQSPADSVVTTIRRDLEGKILELNQGGVVRKYSYNSNHLLARIQEPEKVDTFLSYYGGSALLKNKQVGDHPAITYLYDDADRVTQVIYPENSQNVVTTYTLANKVRTISNGVVTKTFDYDDNGNKKLDVTSIDGQDFRLDFEFDQLDHLKSVTYPNSAAFNGSGAVDRNLVSYNMDALGMPISMNDKFSPIVTSAQYHSNNMYKSITYANGAVSSLNLNTQAWPGTLQVQSGPNLLSYEYKYRVDGNIWAIANLGDSRYDQWFAYDGLNRLTLSYFPNSAPLYPAGATQLTGGAIDYSDTGDITKMTEFAKPTSRMVYDPVTQLLKSSSGQRNKVYTHDDQGRMTSDSVFNFYYDQNHNLTSIASANTGDQISDYVYDGNNIRVKKNLVGESTYYVYSDNKLLFEGSTKNGAKEYFYFGSNLVGSRNLKNENPSYQYMHFNPIASTIAVSKPDQSLIAQQYNSFGSDFLPNPQFHSLTTKRFAGHTSDDETGLIYMGARFYDTHTGRFLTPDPADFNLKSLQSFNKYNYAANNPHKFVDPTGKFVPFLAAAGLIFDVGLAAYDFYNGDTTSGFVGLATAPLGFAGVLVKPVLYTGKYVYRVGERSPQMIRAAGGILPKVKNGPEDMRSLLAWSNYMSVDVNAVSTAKSKAWALEQASNAFFRNSRAAGNWVYTIKNPGNGIDMYKTFGMEAINAKSETEVMFINGIPFEYIYKWQWVPIK